jgi:hypothetical protein
MIGISILWLLLFVAIWVEHIEKRKQGRIRKEKPRNQVFIEGIVSTIKIALSIIVPVWNTIMFIFVLATFDEALKRVPEEVEKNYQPLENSI